MNETLKTDFSALSEKNRASVLEMTKFLVLTQNAIVPKILSPENDAPQDARRKKGIK